MVVAIDLRGLGELHDRMAITYRGMPVTSDWKQWFRAYHLKKSFVGMWTEDVLAVGNWLRTYRIEGKLPHRIRLIGVGHPGVAALHAAALERDLFDHVELRRTLDSGRR